MKSKNQTRQLLLKDRTDVKKSKYTLIYFFSSKNLN